MLFKCLKSLSMLELNSTVLYFAYHSLSYKENQDTYQFLNLILCFKAQKIKEEVLLFPSQM